MLHAVQPQEGDGGIQHVDADVLPFARTLARVQGRSDGLGEVEAGDLVDHRVAHEIGPSVGARLTGCDPARRLHHAVEGGTLGKGAVFPHAAIDT